MKSSRLLSYAIISSSCIIAIGLAYGRYESYLSGKQYEPLVSVSTTSLIIVGLTILAALSSIICLLAAIVFAYTNRYFLNLFLAIIFPVLAFSTDWLPIHQTYYDGVQEHFSQYNETEFHKLAKDIRKLTPVEPNSVTQRVRLPKEIYEKHRLLQILYPKARFHTDEKYVGYSQRIYYAINESHIKVYTSSGREGDRGFVVYNKADQDPYEGAADYIGTYRPVYSHVFTYNRIY